MKRVLLTGASGFIGSYAVAALAERGFDIHAVGRTPLTTGASLFIAPTSSTHGQDAT